MNTTNARAPLEQLNIKVRSSSEITHRANEIRTAYAEGRTVCIMHPTIVMRYAMLNVMRWDRHNCELVRNDFSECPALWSSVILDLLRPTQTDDTEAESESMLYGCD